MVRWAFISSGRICSASPGRRHENLVFAAAWRAAGHSERPTFHGVPYDAMADDPATPLDEAHGFEPHFDRHVWIYRNNPQGVFTPLNPTVSCAAYDQPVSHQHTQGSR
jgi:hypothetical protein